MSDYIEKLRLEIRRLRAELAAAHLSDCRTCNGLGSIGGFLLGTRKTCPACHGSGVRG